MIVVSFIFLILQIFTPRVVIFSFSFSVMSFQCSIFRGNLILFPKDSLVSGSFSIKLRIIYLKVIFWLLVCFIFAYYTFILHILRTFILFFHSFPIFFMTFPFNFTTTNSINVFILLCLYVLGQQKLLY